MTPMEWVSLLPLPLHDREAVTDLLDLLCDIDEPAAQRLLEAILAERERRRLQLTATALLDEQARSIYPTAGERQVLEQVDADYTFKDDEQVYLLRRLSRKRWIISQSPERYTLTEVGRAILRIDRIYKP